MEKSTLQQAESTQRNSLITTQIFSAKTWSFWLTLIALTTVLTSGPAWAQAGGGGVKTITGGKLVTLYTPLIIGNFFLCSAVNTRQDANLKITLTTIDSNGEVSEETTDTVPPGAAVTLVEEAGSRYCKIQFHGKSKDVRGQLCVMVFDTAFRCEASVSAE